MLIHFTFNLLGSDLFGELSVLSQTKKFFIYSFEIYLKTEDDVRNMELNGNYRCFTKLYHNLLNN